MFYLSRDTTIVGADLLQLEMFELKFFKFDTRKDKIEDFLKHALTKGALRRTKRVETSKIRVRFDDGSEMLMALQDFSDNDIYVPTACVVVLTVSPKLEEAMLEHEKLLDKFISEDLESAVDKLGRKVFLRKYRVRSYRAGSYKVLSVSGIAVIGYRARYVLELYARRRLEPDDVTVAETCELVLEEHTYHMAAGEAAKHDVKFREVFEKIGVAEVPVVLLISNKQKIETASVYKCRLCNATLLGFGHAVVHYWVKHCGISPGV